MSAVESGKWDCPVCHRVLSVYGSEPDCRAAIRAVQHRHSRGHAAAREAQPAPAPQTNDRRN